MPRAPRFTPLRHPDPLINQIQDRIASALASIPVIPVALTPQAMIPVTGNVYQAPQGAFSQILISSTGGWLYPAQQAGATFTANDYAVTDPGKGQITLTSSNVVPSGATLWCVTVPP